MCRIAAYTGPAIPLENIVVRPAHSLLTQSQHATEAKLAVNGDGFGIAWYGDQTQPGLYRDVLPAWADGNLLSLCRMVRSSLFIAHVRASTVGETSRANCHPFTYENWSFCHNGQIPHFALIRRRMEAALPDDLFAARRGTTDSEMIFLTLLANGLNDNPSAAMRKMLEVVGPATELGPIRLTCVFSDGKSLYSFRYASDNKCPKLYFSGVLDNGGRSVASEPLCGDASKWTAVPINHVFEISSCGAGTACLELVA
ncbi:MAG: class II glutamine amidotransferase [Yoonia sp.]|nr:class II glutamine amidotransferase [Yoonia sp.]